MPSVRFTFSCTVDNDWDIIEYLDTFATPADRNVAIKAAVRYQMAQVQKEEDFYGGIEDLGKLVKDEMGKMFSLLCDLKEQGVSMPQTVSYRDKRGEHEVAFNNIDKLITGE